jgi:hypothetical protein
LAAPSRKGDSGCSLKEHRRADSPSNLPQKSQNYRENL